MNLYMNDIICILKLITRRGDSNLENIKSIFYFLLAGVFEIGGGYLIWLWLRQGKS